jgi:hypothetical protein
MFGVLQCFTRCRSLRCRPLKLNSVTFEILMAEAKRIQVYTEATPVCFTAKAIQLTEEADGSITIEAVERPPVEQPVDESSWVTGGCDTKYKDGYIFCVPNSSNPCTGSCSLKSNTSGNPKQYWCECS